MKLSLEDGFNDILSKAQKGQGLSTDELSSRSGLDEAAVRGLRRGDFDERSVRTLAQELGLRGEALAALGKGEWYPRQPDPINGFEHFVTPFHNWTVNAYLLWNADSRSAVAFDTGTDPDPILRFLEERSLRLEALCLTHTHRDHIEGLEALRNAFGMKVFVNEKEASAVADAQPIQDGSELTLAGCRLRAIETRGHTEGGTSFLIDGLVRPVAVVGDALFAGSMGGANVSYADALAGVARLLELSKETVLAPGHGPLTTVAEERAMNPFWQPA